MRWLAAHLAAMDMYAHDHRGSMPADDLREADARLQTWLDEGHHRHRLAPVEEQELTTAYADRERARRTVAAQERLEVLGRGVAESGSLTRAERLKAAGALWTIRFYIGLPYWRYLRQARRIA